MARRFFCADAAVYGHKRGTGAAGTGADTNPDSPSQLFLLRILPRLKAAGSVELDCEDNGLTARLFFNAQL